MKEDTNRNSASAALLKPWMRIVLRVGAISNVLAGLAPILFYDEAYRKLGLTYDFSYYTNCLTN
jgi:hypothetical protein